MLNRTQVQLWYNWFKEGREDANDDARSGRQSTPIIVKKLNLHFWMKKKKKKMSGCGK